MERPITKDIGTHLLELDTPSLFIDLSSLITNIKNTNDQFLAQNKKLCPNVSEHGVPAMARIQTSENKTLSEIYVDTFSQAKHFSQGGFSNILIGTGPIGRKRLDYIAGLATHSEITMVASTMRTISDVANVIEDGMRPLSILIPITLSSEIWGLSPGDECAALAKYIGNFKGLNFRGYFLDLEQFSETGKIDYDNEMNKTKDLLYHLGCTGCEVVVKSGDIKQSLMEIPYTFTIVTGLYPFCELETQSHSDTVTCGIVSTVMSVPEKGRAYLDCGQKAISIDKGLPKVRCIDGSYIETMSAEHGYLISDSKLADIELGQRVVLLPSDIGGAFNVHDLVYVIEGQLLQSVWEISSRGYFN